jgi:hypothetical protein
MVRLGKVAADSVGEGFACVVGTLPPNRIRIRIFATTPESLERAEALRRTLERPDRAEAVLTTPRFALDTMQGIYADIESDRPGQRPGPGGRWDVTQPVGAALRRSDCSPITITLQLRDANPALERWAVRAVERHGSDRVILDRAKLADDR